MDSATRRRDRPRSASPPPSTRGRSGPPGRRARDRLEAGTSWRRALASSSSWRSRLPCWCSGPGRAAARARRRDLGRHRDRRHAGPVSPAGRGSTLRCSESCRGRPGWRSGWSWRPAGGALGGRGTARRPGRAMRAPWRRRPASTAGRSRLVATPGLLATRSNRRFERPWSASRSRSRPLRPTLCARGTGPAGSGRGPGSPATPSRGGTGGRPRGALGGPVGGVAARPPAPTVAAGVPGGAGPRGRWPPPICPPAPRRGRRRTFEPSGPRADPLMADLALPEAAAAVAVSLVAFAFVLAWWFRCRGPCSGSSWRSCPRSPPRACPRGLPGWRPG